MPMLCCSAQLGPAANANTGADAAATADAAIVADAPAATAKAPVAPTESDLPGWSGGWS